MLATELTYKPINVTMSPKLTLVIDYASGDEQAGGEVNIFSQLYPLGHAYYGFIDIVGRQNIIDYSSSLSFKPFNKMSVRLGIHYFNRAEKVDGLYNAGSGLVRTGDANASKIVGTEFDLTLNYKIAKSLALSFGFAQLNAGKFLKDTGSDETIQFSYAQILYNF